MDTSINIDDSTSEKDSNTNTSIEEPQVTTDIETAIDDTLIETTMENEAKTQPPTTRPPETRPPTTEAPTTAAPARGKMELFWKNSNCITSLQV